MCEKLSLLKRIKGVFVGNTYTDCSETILNKDSEIEKLTNKLDKCHTEITMANDEYVVIKNQYSELDTVLKEKIKLLNEKDKVIKDYSNSINKLKNELMVLKEELNRSKSENKAINIENAGLINKLKACNIKLAQSLKEIAEKAQALKDKKTKKQYELKLSCKEINNARKEHANGKTIKDLAKELNVSSSTLSRAINCITYKKCCTTK